MNCLCERNKCFVFVLVACWQALTPEKNNNNRTADKSCGYPVSHPQAGGLRNSPVKHLKIMAGGFCLHFYQGILVH